MDKKFDDQFPKPNVITAINLHNCQIHKQLPLSLISLDSFARNEIVFKCSSCPSTRSLNIHEILNSPNNHIISNSALIKDYEYLQLLSLPELNNSSSQIEKIKSFFKEFRQEIHKLEGLQEKIIEIQKQNYDKLIDDYNFLINKSNLKSILMNQSMSLEEKSSLVKVIVTQITNEQRQSSINEKCQNLLSAIQGGSLNQQLAQTKIMIKNNLNRLISKFEIPQKNIQLNRVKYSDLPRIGKFDTYELDNIFGKWNSYDIWNRYEESCHTNFIFQSNNSTNHKEGDQISFLCGEKVVNLPALKMIYLNLRESNVSDTGAKYLSSSISSPCKLKDLTLLLEENQISSKGTQKISTAIQLLESQLTRLTLGLSHNIIDDTGIEYLQQGLSCQPNLIYLDLRLAECFLKEKGGEYLSKCLLNKPQLKDIYLDLNRNSIKDIGCNAIAQELLKFNSLNSLKLYFSSNQISSIGISSMAKVIAQIEDLKDIDFWFSMNEMINNDCYEDISRCFANKKDARSIQIGLRQTQISDKAAISVTDSILWNPKLSKVSFYFSGTQITNKGAKQIAQNISQKESLQKIELYFEGLFLSDQIKFEIQQLFKEKLIDLKL